VIDASGRLVGIVSHSDVLKIFLRPDSDIRRDVLDQVIFGGLVPAPERIQVRVRDGVVLLEGTCQRRGLIPVLVRAVAGVEGSCGSRTGSASAWTTSPRCPTP
jgi:hypothetical protein